MGKTLPSSSTWGERRVETKWGEHHNTIPHLLWVVLKNTVKPASWHKGVMWFLWGYLLWGRIKHRHCDTIDFHHYACTLDAYGRKMDADYRWEKAWKPRPTQTRHSQ